MLPGRFETRSRVRRRRRRRRLPPAACQPLTVGSHPRASERRPPPCHVARLAHLAHLARLARLALWSQGFNPSQPPVPILATSGYKLSPSLMACVAPQTTMFSTPYQHRPQFELRCTRVAESAASVNSASLRSMTRRRANQSLELTCPGRPSWPRSSRDFAHFLLRGQAVLPGHAAQLKR